LIKDGFYDEKIGGGGGGVAFTFSTSFRIPLHLRRALLFCTTLSSAQTVVRMTCLYALQASSRAMFANASAS
jgi:hypothetical protein